MMHTLLLIKLLLFGYTTHGLEQIEAKCNSNVSLHCRGEGKDLIHMKNFVSVAWYKLSPHRVGIIRKSKGDSKGVPYTNSTASIGKNYSLLLYSVTPKDSGLYDCDVGADIGGQNMNFYVNLTVHECVAELSTVASVPSTTNASSCITQVEDLSVMWSTVCFVGVSIVKITLCVISIWVVRVYISRQHRRW